MKRIVRLTENDLVRLVNKVLDEQLLSSKGLSLVPNMSQGNKAGCKKPSSAQELSKLVQSKITTGDLKDGDFHCFNITPAIKSKLRGLPFGLFKFDKVSNVLSLYDSAGYFKHLFTGNQYGDFLVKIKMGNDFASKLPADTFDEDSAPIFEVQGSKICLSVGGYC